MNIASEKALHSIQLEYNVVKKDSLCGIISVARENNSKHGGAGKSDGNWKWILLCRQKA